MLRIRNHIITVSEEFLDLDDLHSTSSLQFFEPNNADEATAIRDWLLTLENGEIIYVRGRDTIHLDFEESNSENLDTTTTQYTPWSTGVALKKDARLFLLWEHDVEFIRIDGCNFMDQLQLLCADSTSKETRTSTNYEEQKGGIESSKSEREKVVILCHGFSYVEGPNYALIYFLANRLRRHYRVIIPDFRPSYAFGPTRGRSERVRIIMEELLVLAAASGGPQPEVVLMGHSQGGAAIAQLCGSARVIAAANIKALVMMGSESPVEQLRPPYSEDDEGNGTEVSYPTIHTTKPVGIDSDKILFIHSSRDRVIHSLQIQQLAELWGCPQSCITLSDDALPDHSSASWADDVQHDFLNNNMLREIANLTSQFLDQCFS